MAAPPLVEFKTILGRSVEINLFLLFSTPINPTGIPIIKLGNSLAFSKISIKYVNAVGELPITTIGDFIPEFLTDNSFQPSLKPYAVLVNFA